MSVFKPKDFINDAFHILVLMVALLPLAATLWAAPWSGFVIGMYHEITQERATELERARHLPNYQAKNHWQIVRTMGPRKWRDVAGHAVGGLCFSITSLAIR